MLNFFDLIEGNVAFLQTLVALRRTGCDVWQLECQASNVTASVQSDHLLHGYMFPVFVATDQLHSPPRSGEIQPMSQQYASATCLHCGFILDTSALAACSRRGNLPGWVQNCWLATRTDELGCLTTQKLDCVTSTMCWRIVLMEDNHVSSNAADCC